MRLFRLDRHRRWHQRLSAYIDERLEARERRELERHLETCPSCQEGLNSLRVTVDLLRRMPQVAVPQSFTLTKAMAPAPVSWSARYVLPLRYAAAAAAALLLAVALGDLLIPSSEGTTPAVAPHQLEEGPSQATPAAAPMAPAMDAALPADAPAPTSLAPTPDPAAPEAATQELQAPSAFPPAAEKDVSGEARVIPDETAPGPEPVYRSTFSRVLDWLQLGLGAVLTVLVFMVLLQWWMRRRATPSR